MAFEKLQEINTGTAERAIDNELVSQFKAAHKAAGAADNPADAAIEANHASMIWGELYGRHISDLRSHLWRKTAGPEELEDILQETFLRAYNGIRLYDETEEKSTFGGWLKRVGSNIAIDAHRKKQRLPPSSLDISVHPIEPVSQIGNPETDTVGVEYMQLLGLAPDTHRSVIDLVDGQGKKYEEAAEALGININTVRSRLNRGRLGLLRALLEYVEANENPDDYLTILIRSHANLFEDEAAS
ncbi:MAG: polymerase, sigma-24 subunit, subfamily [Candidatus Saccharibacteria bacterium]|nr:polymerase, sigma-24 subunit, subfamily [Candidatus Saccharibacteria bacterium]